MTSATSDVSERRRPLLRREVTLQVIHCGVGCADKHPHNGDQPTFDWFRVRVHIRFVLFLFCEKGKAVNRGLTS